MSGIASPSRAWMARHSGATKPPTGTTAGSERVSRRGRARVPSTPGTGRIQKSSESRSEEPIARIPLPSGSQSTARQTPSTGLIRTPGPGAPSGGFRFGGRPGAAPRGRGHREGCDEQVDQPVAEQRVNEPAAVRRRQGRPAEAAVVVAVIDRAGREGRPIAAVERHADDLEPAVAVGRDEEPAAVGEPARARLPGPGAGNDPLLTAGRVDDGHLHRGEIGVALGEHRDAAAVRRPREVFDVHPDLRQGPRLGTRLAGRPRTAAGKRGGDHPRLAPAAAARDEGDPAPVGRPARRVLPGRVIRDDRRPGPVDRRRSRSPSPGRTPAATRPATSGGR